MTFERLSLLMSHIGTAFPCCWAGIIRLQPSRLRGSYISRCCVAHSIRCDSRIVMSSQSKNALRGRLWPECGRESLRPWLLRARVAAPSMKLSLSLGYFHSFEQLITAAFCAGLITVFSIAVHATKLGSIRHALIPCLDANRFLSGCSVLAFGCSSLGLGLGLGTSMIRWSRAALQSLGSIDSSRTYGLPLTRSGPLTSTEVPVSVT